MAGWSEQTLWEDLADLAHEVRTVRAGIIASTAYAPSGVLLSTVAWNRMLAELAHVVARLEAVKGNASNADFLRGEADDIERQILARMDASEWGDNV